MQEVENGYYWLKDEIVKVENGSYFRFKETYGRAICYNTPELVGPIRKQETQREIPEPLEHGQPPKDYPEETEPGKDGDNPVVT